ncbi:MAG: hypothetical protein M3P42_02880 [Actinomycetota bacterium]|nr:hypothetical protein [Actinomycetota bacterium]
MTLRLPTRALVPVVVLAVLGGVVATFIIARPPSSAGDDNSSLVQLAKPAPVKKPAPAKAQKRPVKTPVQPAAKPAAKPVPVPVVKPLVPVKPAVEPGGLPSLLSAALLRNRVVVVGLYDPDAAVDGIALAEARAGASAAGAGFLAINVFAEAQSRPLLELLGALENPSVLVYRRPDALFARIGGFADSETVAQAAANARR